MGAPAYGGVDVSKFIKTYKTISSSTGTNPAAQDVIPTILYYCSETILATINMMSCYLGKYWLQLKEELKDAFHCTDSQVLST
jgi:hypothetical protein